MIHIQFVTYVGVAVVRRNKFKAKIIVDNYEKLLLIIMKLYGLYLGDIKVVMKLYGLYLDDKKVASFIILFSSLRDNIQSC